MGLPHRLQGARQALALAVRVGPANIMQALCSLTHVGSFKGNQLRAWSYYGNTAAYGESPCRAPVQDELDSVISHNLEHMPGEYTSLEQCFNAVRAERQSLAGVLNMCICFEPHATQTIVLSTLAGDLVVC